LAVTSATSARSLVSNSTMSIMVFSLGNVEKGRGGPLPFIRWSPLA
jgi:hypothetical protein